MTSSRSARPRRNPSARAVSMNGNGRARAALTAAATRAAASSTSYNGLSLSPVAASIEPPTTPMPAGRPRRSLDVVQCLVLAARGVLDRAANQADAGGLPDRLGRGVGRVPKTLLEIGGPRPGATRAALPRGGPRH